MISADIHDDRLLLLHEVAALFGVDRTTVSKWARIGRLPTCRTPGGQYRIRAADAYAALQANSDNWGRRP